MRAMLHDWGKTMRPLSKEDPIPAAVFATLEGIARRRLGITTLQKRYSDRLDFHDVGVSGLSNALYEAYLLGVQSAQASETDSS